MLSHKQDMVLPYAADDMYELVSGIERYPEFVRWIKALRVRDETLEAELRSCVGEAVVAFKGFTQTFATSVKADPVKRRVDVGLVRGPLKHLDNVWRFVPLEDGRTRIEFFVEYEFSNFILRALAKSNHQYAIDKIMQTFLDEAKRRYKPVGMS